jgi:hypothetical protein
MTLTIVATSGSASANSFVTEAEQIELFGGIESLNPDMYPNVAPSPAPEVSGAMVLLTRSSDPETKSYALANLHTKWASDCECWRVRWCDVEDIASDFNKALSNVRELVNVSSTFKSDHVRTSVEDKTTAMRRDLERESREFQSNKHATIDELEMELVPLFEKGKTIWSAVMAYRGCHGAMPAWFKTSNTTKLQWIATGGSFFTKMKVKYYEKMRNDDSGSDSDSDKDSKPKAKGKPNKKRAIRCLS